jgi:hypothetical protein
MSAERPLPAASALSHRAFLLGAFVLHAACSGTPAPYVVSTHASPDRSLVAAVRLAQCGTNWCDSLWIGATDQTATLVATLPHAAERATEIAWSKDGRRVGFLINGHQLRLFDAETKAPAGQLDLVPPDAQPTTRIARGVTFSENGAAITFDDCPRDRSGCRPGLVALQ